MLRVMIMQMVGDWKLCETIDAKETEVTGETFWVDIGAGKIVAFSKGGYSYLLWADVVFLNSFRGRERNEVDA